MSDTLIATLGGLVAMVAWGTSDWFTAKSSRLYDYLAVNMAIQLPGLIIWPILMLITQQPLPSLEHILIISLAGIIFTAAWLFFIKALAKGSVGIIVPVASTFPIITIVLTVIFLTSIFTGLQYLTMAVIIFGVFLLAFEKNKENIPLRELHRETAFALTAAFFWGLGNFLQNTVIGKESWIAIVTLVNISMGFSALILVLFIKGSTLVKTFSQLKNNHMGLIAGFTLSLGSVGFYFGSDRAKSVIIPSVVAAASPLVASFWSRVLDKEKLTIIKRVGAVIVVAGIIMLNIF